MDVPGIPIRFVESLLLYYFDEDKLQLDKVGQVILFHFLATPFIYTLSAMFAPFANGFTPIVMLIFLIDPSIFVEITDNFTFWELFIGQVSFFPKDGFPKLLAEAEDILYLMFYQTNYLKPDYVPEFGMMTLAFIWVIGAIQVEFLPVFFGPMFTWLMASSGVMTTLFLYDIIFTDV